jgi:hypothetical protein
MLGTKPVHRIHALEAKFTEAENLVDHPLRKGLELIGFGNGLLLEHVEFGWRVWAREG